MKKILTYQFLISGLLFVMTSVVTERVAAQSQVSGTVVDLTNQSPLPAVNISVKGTQSGTQSNIDGEYNLPVTSLSDTLVFSYVGYETQEIPINNRTEINVELAPGVITGEELIVVGYGSTRARDLTGSVSTVQSDRLNPVGSTSINQMMQGRVPGLNLATRGAQPGSGVNVNIRGAISIGGSNTPLYVIDGVPMTSYNSTVPSLQSSDLGFGGGIDRDPLSYLNPSDIESITVMKDASATAIYGSAAANGVVLVTTRGGRSGALEVDYRTSYSVQTPKEYMPLMNARQFMEQQTRLSHDFHLYDQGLAPYGDTDPADAEVFVPLFSQSDIANAGAGTDWVDAVTRQGSIHEHNLSMSGGTDQTRIYSSFGYHDNPAVLKNSEYTRYSGRFNLDQTINDWAELRVRMNIGQQDGNNMPSGSSSGGAEKFHVIEAMTTFAPNLPVRTEDGSYSKHYNPLIMNPVSFLDMKDQSRTNNLFFTPTLELNLSDNFMFNVTGQLDRESTTRGFYLPRTSNHALLPEGMAQKQEASRTNYAGEGYLTYTNSFANSDLTVVAGAGLYYAENDGFDIEAIGFFTDAFQDHNIGVSHDIQRNRIRSFRNDQTKLSQFMRVNYSLLDKYIVTLVGRRDGSSVFAENEKYGFFPGVSAAWIISEENFMSNMNALTELKLRVGYGQSGNESVLSGNTLQLYAPGNEYVIGGTLYNGVALDQIANPNLTWETVTSMNVGLDFRFFENRIRGSFDVFQKQADNLLQFNPLPFNSPVGDVADNVGSTRSYGYELALNTLNVATPTFIWSSDFTLSWSEAKWVERNPRVALNPWVGEQDLLGTIYGAETAGIIRSESDIPPHQPNANLGNLIYVDQNGDGELNNDDVVTLGNNRPKWSVGLRNQIDYRNFSLSVYAYGNLDFLRGNNFAPGGNIRLEESPTNTTIYAQDIWSATNPDGTFPGVAPNPHGGNISGGTDFNLYDASFIRIQDVTVGYNLPANVLNLLAGIRGARVFATLQNIGVFTNYPGYDPEYTESNPYPHSYSTTVGVDVRF